MTTNADFNYQFAAAGLIRAIGEHTTAKHSPVYPEELVAFLDRLDDLVCALTVIKNDWRRLRNEEIERARQAELAATPTEPDTYPA